MNPKHPTKSTDITGAQKAALLLIALNVETASTVFKYLDGEEVELISTEITKVKNIPSHVVDNVMHTNQQSVESFFDTTCVVLLLSF